MRPQLFAAEYCYYYSSLKGGQMASMRPQLFAAEYARARIGRLSGLYPASMRPQLFAAEYNTSLRHSGRPSRASMRPQLFAAEYAASRHSLVRVSIALQ